MASRPQPAKKILLADDNPAVRDTAGQVLAAAGYQVLPAADGIEALALLEREAPDMLMCGVALARLDGLSACMLVRRNERHAGLPIVMLSDAAGLFDQARCAMAGADGYLAKPFSEEGLLQVVRAHVDGVDGA
ncbi:response regulator [Herbaspirillum sp. SJZ099]|uniref:response regulator n=1 Tax=Herbaspirillum sp. SJZ099 TaxID=2572916 RepID=UPI0011ABA17B|nr:response regulator [Herbaspirillum sp. SJZ099]TWC62792.1 response regulator receiver protein [Herbaspirillum sp. SJZ099]